MIFFFLFFMSEMGLNLKKTVVITYVISYDIQKEGKEVISNRKTK